MYTHIATVGSSIETWFMSTKVSGPKSNTYCSSSHRQQVRATILLSKSLLKVTNICGLKYKIAPLWPILVVV